MRGFYDKNPEFKGVPLYIYGQSYGGKMAIDMGIRMHQVRNNPEYKPNQFSILAKVKSENNFVLGRNKWYNWI